MSERHLHALGRHGDALLRAIGTDPERPLQSRAGWDAGALLEHLGTAHRFWAEVVEGGGTERPATAFPDPPREALAEWAATGLDHLIAALEFTPPGRMVWSGAGPQPVTWVRRRMAVATVLQRWDVERAEGTPRPIDGDLAVDGIDELLDFFVATGGPPIAATSVHLHAADDAGEWTVLLTPDGVEVLREHRRGDAAIRGTASDLLLLLWGRSDDAEVIGDAGAVALLRGRVDLAAAEGAS